VLTELDFGNATLAGIQSFQLNRLQAVMNAAVRMVFQSNRREHITPLLYRLHWLRAPQRIVYKHAVLVYQCLRGLAPAYMTDDLQPVAELQVDDVYGHHRPRHWLYHGHAFEPLATTRFPLQQQGHGTVCRRK